VTQNYPSLETAATAPTRSVCRFGFVRVPLPSLIAVAKPQPVIGRCSGSLLAPPKLGTRSLAFRGPQLSGHKPKSLIFATFPLKTLDTPCYADLASSF